VTLPAPIKRLAQQKQNKADPESGKARQSKVLCSAGEVKKALLRRKKQAATAEGKLVVPKPSSSD
jgi:hypothetical protein